MTLRHVSILFAAAAAFALIALAPSEARAQYYQPVYEPPHTTVVYPRGLYLGFGLAGTRILHQEGGVELLEDGGGFVAYAGMRVNRSLALELGWMGSLHNPVEVSTAFGPDTDYLVLNGFTADAKIYLGNSDPRLEPYLQAGLGAYLLDSEYFGAQSAGTGFQVGGGFDYEVGPRVHLGLRGLYRGMSMGPPEGNYNDTFVSALTVEGNIGVRF